MSVRLKDQLNPIALMVIIVVNIPYLQFAAKMDTLVAITTQIVVNNMDIMYPTCSS